jgi:hypothetical protein
MEEGKSTLIYPGIPALKLCRGNTVGFGNAVACVAGRDLIEPVAVVDDAGQLGGWTGARVFGWLGGSGGGGDSSGDVDTDVVVQPEV